MPKEKTHDLHDFMQQLQDRMAAHYKQIQKRATEDPGTAGDQGEENWAELLRGWLPRTYEVVTKGRIISQDGDVSPQVDVLVLKSIYPKQLIDEGQKIFLAAGVAAAFECKTTLTAAHIAEAMETCVKIKSLYPVREGTPYKELHSPIIYGLLAQSHSWKSPKSTPEKNIEEKLQASDKKYVSHPRECLDLLCIADLGTWISSKITFFSPRMFPGNEWAYPKHLEPDGVALSSYIGHTDSYDNQFNQFTPIGTLISDLSQRLAWEDSTLRDLVHYYQTTHIDGTGKGESRIWPSSIYSKEVRLRAEHPQLSSGPDAKWDEWKVCFFFE
ncbi:MAG: hypothetical protein OXI63_01520 [Candidatus Poribacteria bacterium]|nr:hypothetical protein [Candidatus Poribacteria bacterium]